MIDKKAAEIETLTKQNTSMRETVERMDREKVLLNNKLKNAIKLSSKADKAPTGYTDTQIYTQVRAKGQFNGYWMLISNLMKFAFVLNQSTVDILDFHAPSNVI